ncbi:MULTISPECIES: hypothetical protein [unclassified Paenibacillus]|uniref:hypothetical protein n=1 Tax=unclassified Paenibacillus TaxID=185978 RepID=UPI00041B3F9B|nr:MULTISPECIES: hypothetical protein [unclassified Paenibacillus]KGP79576.1 hypothetical protein P364_0123625 [Paenibacillus sp. MAEPY2]KGP80452.1 hypothetical protein P363_0130385 [Paenibacillus sp. MAEPY1]
MDTKDKDQEIMERSEAIAIQYLKDTYDLDVTITRKQMQPKMAMSWVTFYGYVSQHEEQSFNVSINYEENRTESFSFSPELEEFLLTEGYDPYKLD